MNIKKDSLLPGVRLLMTALLLFLIYHLARQAAMLTMNCPLANGPKGCLHCKTPGALTDRMGKSFPVMCRKGGCWGVEVFNSVSLWLGGLPLTGLDFGVFRFTLENSAECGRVLSCFSRDGALDAPFTRGLYRRGAE